MRKVIIISIGVSAITAIVLFAVIGAAKDAQNYNLLSAELDSRNLKMGIFLKVDSYFDDAIDSAKYYEVKARYWMNEGDIDSFVKYIRKAEYHLGRMESAYKIEKNFLQ